MGRNVNTEMYGRYQDELRKRLGIAGTKEHMAKAAQTINTTLLSGGGALAQNLSDAFIDLVVDESTLLPAMRLVRVTERSGEMSKLDVSGHITEQATENNTSTETRTHTNTILTYQTVKTRSQFDITMEVAEDNIEGSSGQNTILNALVRHIMNDMETLVIEGDSSVSDTDDKSRLVKANDGLNALLTTANGAHLLSAGAKRISWELLRQMYKALPTRYRRNRQNLRWIMSSNTLLDLLAEPAGRSTNLGDAMWLADAPPAPLGIPILEVPLWPEDLTVTGTASTGTFCVLADPNNFLFVVQRDLTVHTEFNQRYDRTEVTAFMRHDVLVENADAVVKATNIVLDEPVARYAA